MSSRRPFRAASVVAAAVMVAFAASIFELVVRATIELRDIGTLVSAVAAASACTIVLVDNRKLHERLTEATDALGGRERQLEHLAFHDPLTDLANRPLFHDRLLHALAMRARRPAPVGVLFVDIDDFKTVNDSVGRDTGDALLVAVAQRLRACVRAGDTAARLGGDHFGVLIDDLESDLVSLGLIATRIIETLGAPFDVSGLELTLSASVGIAFSEHGQAQCDEMLRDADLAASAAKARGKSCYEVFVPGMAAAVIERRDLRAALAKAIDSGAIEVAYQPIVELSTGRVRGVEALACWRDPERGDVPPARFLPVAEESGHIHEVGRTVLQQACRAAVRWLTHAPDGFTISVNVSARQLAAPELFADVVAALTTSGLAARHLMLEVAESVFSRESSGGMDRLRALRDIGVKVAVDDFGSGYSSLAQLPRLPVDVIKIDQAFARDLCDEAVGATLTRLIVQLAQRLSLETIAQGVEQEAEAEVLASIGCTAAQGSWFSRPQPLELVAVPGSYLWYPELGAPHL